MLIDKIVILCLILSQVVLLLLVEELEVVGVGEPVVVAADLAVGVVESIPMRVAGEAEGAEGAQPPCLHLCQTRSARERNRLTWERRTEQRKATNS